MSKTILVLAGDGVGPEIVAEGVKIIEALRSHHGLQVTLEHGLIGGVAWEGTGSPLPKQTLAAARHANAVLLGAVGGPQWDGLKREQKPEWGLLSIRSSLGLYANLRPALLYPQLAAASSLKEELVSGLDLMIVRELTGGIYFGKPRGVRHLDNGEKEGFNTLVYRESEIERVAKVAFEIAGRRDGRVCSVDKANVLEATVLWRQTVERVSAAYPRIELSHMYVDNAAMQLVRAPKQFDVMLTTNMFGDILSDCAAMLTGSIGMLPSASLNEHGQGLYEPIHGSAPDIAGRGVANPLATILSIAMMLRHSLGRADLADKLDRAVGAVLDRGLRTADILSPGTQQVGTAAMGDAVVAALAEL